MEKFEELVRNGIRAILRASWWVDHPERIVAIPHIIGLGLYASLDSLVAGAKPIAALPIFFGSALLGLVIAFLPACHTRSMIQNMKYRKSHHDFSAFGCALTNLVCYTPMIAIVGKGMGYNLSSVFSSPFYWIILVVTTGIGIAGHAGKSRTWDLLWIGGGPLGALASYLDHLYHGSSPDVEKDVTTERN